MLNLLRRIFGLLAIACFVAILASPFMGLIGKVIGMIAVLILIIMALIIGIVSFFKKSGPFIVFESNLGELNLKSTTLVISDLLDYSENQSIVVIEGTYEVTAKFKKYQDDDLVNELDQLTIVLRGQEQEKKGSIMSGYARSGELLIGDSKFFGKLNKDDLHKLFQKQKKQFKANSTFVAFLQDEANLNRALISTFPYGAGEYQFRLIESDVGVIGLEFKMVADEYWD